MQSTYPTICAALFALAIPGHARAETASLFQSHFAQVQGGTPCYARTYDQAHLKDHPEQKVARMILSLDKVNADGKPVTEEALELGFSIQTRSSSEWYSNLAICKSAGVEIGCFLDGDGGKFTITAADAGALKVTNGSYGIAIEGSADFVELPGDKGDDLVFILQPADRTECNAAAAATQK